MERPAGARPAALRSQPRLGWSVRRRWLALLAATGILALGFVPTETRQGVDFVVSTRTVPLYAKALDFVHRDLSYARLAEQIAGEQVTPQARALAVFGWTRRNVRDVPSGFPVVDDHVWHIIIRGYGANDQKADVFTTLTTYVGVPAFFGYANPEPPSLVLSFVWIDDAWRVFDVEHGVVFRNRQGQLASVEELAEDRALAAAHTPDRWDSSRPYARNFERFAPPAAPDILRSELQMLWPRMTYPVKRLLGFGRRAWQQAR